MPPPVAAAIQAAPAPSTSVATSIARWNSLRQSDNLPFSAYASFLLSHPGWPGESAMRRTAERRAEPGAASPGEVVRFFATFPPLTPAGHARHALALLAAGRVDEARETARTAWKAGPLSATDEQRLLGAFGAALTPQDHDARMEVLLANGDVASARRSLMWSTPARRPVYEARLALQGRAPDAASRLAALGSAGAGDPGLLIDRANWLRNTDPLAARQLLAQPHRLTAYPANPAKHMETLVTMARGAANDRQWTLAYGIASQVDGLYPPGTDVSQKSFDERDEYTNLTWLAGTTALLRMNRPADAVGMFERYARAAQSPPTQTKGLYWAARAAQRAGQAERSRAFLQEAARHYDQYYGQLAAERLGQTLPAPSAPPVLTFSAADLAAFQSRPIVAAVTYLGQTGNWRDQTQFVRALAEQVRSDNERLLAVQLGQRIGRPDLGVLVARRARTDGSFEYKRWGFPEVNVPPAQQRHWTMVHAITRQESLFDRQAVSSAGARGLMQLMPATAREVAGRLGVSYEPSRLTDPQYNVLLGSTYFARLLDQWGGNYPLAVASYNAGAGNVRRWINANGDPRTSGVAMIDWIEEIPFFETRNYVQRVLENAVVYDLLNPDRARSPSQNRLSYYLGESQPN
ncbi:lytic transglycosylase domain-containing protein [Sphingosinicella sp. CPCC 101087]|uniref:lytic transglycosylase domain-containing protein n=1 Tax=Sphingosinicella sp. CPCC 101087 TaxID=2497754 RepID=UPI001FB1435B|nr:lytic transglycosylase domain-containing protein [Sphingosinicella sp. CPCC 101087]